MTNPLVALLGVAGQVFLALALLTAFVLYLWLPYMAWSATRNIRQIRIQLERLNDILEASPRGARSGPLGI